MITYFWYIYCPYKSCDHHNKCGMRKIVCLLICLPSEKLTVDAKYLPKNVFDLPCI